MNAEEIKMRILTQYYYSNCMVLTEHRNLSDVYVIRANGYCAEIEVKVSKADLRGEIKAIRAAELVNKTGDLWTKAIEKVGKFSITKYRKHSDYLLGDNQDKYKYLPNDFYFGVPRELQSIAVEGVKGTPYGVIVVTRSEYGSDLEVVVKSKKLHTVKLDESGYRDALRRAINESYKYRYDFWDSKNKLTN